MIVPLAVACFRGRMHCGLVCAVGSLCLSLSATQVSSQTPGNRPVFPRQRQATIDTEAPSRPHPSVCRIIAPERGAISYGSGTLVAVKDEFGLVLTNWHVVRDTDDVPTVVFPDGYRSGARIIRLDRDWDLAALVIWRPPAEPVTIATSPPQRGDVLTIAGYGSGDYREATGRCTQYVSPGIDLPFEMVEVSVEARQGDSGGPIFNQEGELAGVLFGAGDGTTSGSYAGRVGTFLASISPELGEPESTQIASVAEPSPGQIPAEPAEPPQPRTQPVDRRTDLNRDGQLVNVMPLLPDSTPPVPPFTPPVFNERPAARELTLRDLAGDNPFQWLKTGFALVGALAVLSRLTRKPA